MYASHRPRGASRRLASPRVTQSSGHGSEEAREEAVSSQLPFYAAAAVVARARFTGSRRALTGRSTRRFKRPLLSSFFFLFFFPSSPRPVRCVFVLLALSIYLSPSGSRSLVGDIDERSDSRDGIREIARSATEDNRPVCRICRRRGEREKQWPRAEQRKRERE